MTTTSDSRNLVRSLNFRAPGQQTSPAVLETSISTKGRKWNHSTVVSLSSWANQRWHSLPMLGSDLVARRLSWDCAGNMTPDCNLSQLKSYSLSNGRCRNPTSSENSEREVVLV